jgi:ribose transport system ATP-binding protein
MAQAAADAPVALRATGLSKTFMGQKALDDVDITLRGGRVCGLVGQNGSGKSTLIKLFAGFHKPDPGAQATVNGEEFDFGSPAAADAVNMRFVHQDLALIQELDTIDNLALQRGFGSRWWIANRREAANARRLLAAVGCEADPSAPINRLSAVDRTLVAVARALRDIEQERPSVLVLDEPTEALTKVEVERLFASIKRVTELGTAVLYVSHRLDEVLDISDDIIVLRDGRLVATRESAELDGPGLLRLIVGREIEQLEDTHSTAKDGESVLAVAGLTGTSCVDVSFAVRRGEILGIAGLDGSGREELPYLIGGATKPRAGAIDLEGRRFTRLSTSTAVRSGLVLVPADRLRNGIMPTLSAAENVTLSRLEPAGPLSWIGGRRERADAEEWMRTTGVVPPDPDLSIELFSGGNQQKAVIARALRSGPKVLLLDEPVQGVDAGARAAIFQLLLDAAAEGMTIVIASTEPEDLTTVCDRILVMRQGGIAVELEGAGAASIDRIVEHSMDVSRDQKESAR